MAVTIKEIALRAGVSPGAVSTVINGAKTNIRVGEKTRERIKEVAGMLQYRPNLMARGLRNSKTNLVGVVAPRIDFGFWPKILQGIESVLEEVECNIIFCSTEDNPESERRNLTLLWDKGVDGIITVPALHSSNLGLYSKLSESELPVVCVACTFEGLRVPFVYVDPYKIGLLAGQYLAGMGHKCIGCIGKSEEEIYVGFRDAINEAGLEVDENLIIREGRTFEEAYESTKKLLARANPPTAVFTTKEVMAVGIMRAAGDCGMKVPEDISVLGSDDTEISRLLEVPLSCIGQPKEEQGQEAAKLLMKMINGKKGENVVLEPYLAERRSVVNRGTKNDV